MSDTRNRTDEAEFSDTEAWRGGGRGGGREEDGKEKKKKRQRRLPRSKKSGRFLEKTLTNVFSPSHLLGPSVAYRQLLNYSHQSVGERGDIDWVYNE